MSALRTQYEDALQFLFAITALILLIACANLANLLLARASARDREVAVRVAIGASRMALIRQFAAESCVLAAAGAIVAIVLARRWLGHLLLYAIATGGGAPDLTLSTDWRVLAVCDGCRLCHMRHLRYRTCGSRGSYRRDRRP